MCNVKNGPCLGEHGCMLETICSDRAAQLKAERLRNNNQHGQPKICPSCKGDGYIDIDGGAGGDDVCRTCNGTGKLQA